MANGHIDQCASFDLPVSGELKSRILSRGVAIARKHELAARFVNRVVGKVHRTRRAVAQQIFGHYLRSHIRDRSFSIVSNNCWGAERYRILRLPYLTPFVGLFIHPECYLRLLRDFGPIVRSELTFKPTSRHASIESWRSKELLPYPIGEIGNGVEIHFMHYQSADEAREKWLRRVDRLPADSNALFFKFCDRDSPTTVQLKDFDALPFDHKVCFVSRPIFDLASTVWIRDALPQGFVPDGQELFWKSLSCFDIEAWLRGEKRPAGLLSRLLAHLATS